MNNKLGKSVADRVASNIMNETQTKTWNFASGEILQMLYKEVLNPAVVSFADVTKAKIQEKFTLVNKLKNRTRRFTKR